MDRIFNWVVVYGQIGWQIYDAESSELASEVMRDICERENIAPNQVVLQSADAARRKALRC